MIYVKVQYTKWLHLNKIVGAAHNKKLFVADFDEALASGAAGFEKSGMVA